MSDGKPHLETFLNHVWLLLLTDSVVCDDEEMHNKIFMNFLRRHRSMKSMQEDKAKLCEIPQKSISQRHMTLHLPIIIDSCEHFFLHL